jgi:hypothetical protein
MLVVIPFKFGVLAANGLCTVVQIINGSSVNALFDVLVHVELLYRRLRLLHLLHLIMDKAFI